MSEQLPHATQMAKHEVRSPGALLRYLWLLILTKVSLSPQRLDQLLTEYTDDHIAAQRRSAQPSASTAKRVSKLINAKGNLRSLLLTGQTLTFTKFMTGVKVLGVCRLRISLQLEWRSGRTVEVSTDVDIGSHTADEDEREEHE